MKRIIIQFLMILVTALGCNSSEITPVPPIADGQRTYREFVPETKEFPYTISEIRKKRIISNYSALSIGMTKKEVSSIIGDPDFSEYLTAKEPPGKYSGSEWSYYFYKPNLGLVNEKLDRGLFLFFGTDDKLHGIVPKNLGGLIEKGNPVQSRS